MIFDGVDLDIRRGRVTAIMGPSGTGKTMAAEVIAHSLSLPLVIAAEHARDAGGLCLWLLRPPSKKAQKAARAVVELVAKEPKRAHAVSDVRAERNAAGCTCQRRHVKSCVLYKPMTYRERANVLHSPPAADGVSPPQDAVGGR